MLELLAIFYLWSRVGDYLDDKGYETTVKYQILVPVFWLGGEFVFAFLYGIVLVAHGWAPGPLETYGVALVGALAGTGLLFVILHRLPRREVPEGVYRRRRRR